MRESLCRAEATVTGGRANGHGALGVVGRREHAEFGDVSIDGPVSLLQTEDRGLTIEVELDVTLPQVQDPSERPRSSPPSITCAHSNATRGNVRVALSAGGHPIA